MVLISLDLGEDFNMDGVFIGAPLLSEALEYVCVVWFTGELALRFLCVRDKCRFSKSVPNVIDLLAVLPFYVTLVVEKLHGGSTQLENMGRVVQVLRLLRSLRMLKLGRHSTGQVSKDCVYVKRFSWSPAAGHPINPVSPQNMLVPPLQT